MEKMILLRYLKI